MRYFVLAPSDFISGGPELAHQMCQELTKNKQAAFMYYVNIRQKEPVDHPVPAPYAKYQTVHEVNIEQAEKEDAVVIFNDGTTTYIPVINHCRKVLWWMSVDNYIYTTQEEDIDIIRKQVHLHLVQSHYAYNYVKNKIGIAEENILYVSDYINEEYGKFILPDKYRQNIALYNPKKGFEDLKPLMQMTPQWKWMPLIDLNLEQMIVLMQGAKVYVDFGGHPGKDRIPREAASCGCCVITNQKGSAAYEEDVPIPIEYKFKDVPKQYPQIADLLADIFCNFQEHSRRFDSYRDKIKMERQQFEQSVQQFIAVSEQRWETSASGK